MSGRVIAPRARHLKVVESDQRWRSPDARCGVEGCKAIFDARLRRRGGKRRGTRGREQQAGTRGLTLCSRLTQLAGLVRLVAAVILLRLHGRIEREFVSGLLHRAQGIDDARVHQALKGEGETDQKRHERAHGVAMLAPADYQSDMPAFGAILSDDEIWSVLAFIRSRWSESARAKHDEFERS